MESPFYGIILNGSIRDHLAKNKYDFSENVLSNYFFQFVYKLTQIQKMIPEYCHNDTHTSNNLVQLNQYWSKTIY